MAATGVGAAVTPASVLAGGSENLAECKSVAAVRELSHAGSVRPQEGSAVASGGRQTLKGGAAENAEQQPRKLALEITSDDGRPKSYTPVPPAGSKTTGVWFGRYNREPLARAPGGQSGLGQVYARPDAAVKFVPEMEGDAVRVSLSVLVGQYRDKEKAVASFLIRENETVRVPGLVAYNVAAFEVRAVSAAINR